CGPPSPPWSGVASAMAILGRGLGPAVQDNFVAPPRGLGVQGHLVVPPGGGRRSLLPVDLLGLVAGVVPRRLAAARERPPYEELHLHPLRGGPATGARADTIRRRPHFTTGLEKFLRFPAYYVNRRTPEIRGVCPRDARRRPAMSTKGESMGDRLKRIRESK